MWSALHHSVPFSLILIVLFMSSYALVDGLYLLVRGLLLRLKPAVFVAPEGKAGSPPDLLADLPTARRAIIFVRYGGAHGLGHVGWVFEWNNGWFNVGAMENEEGTPFTQTTGDGLLVRPYGGSHRGCAEARDRLRCV